jgi:site-specific DNA-methyltransferase (adenine-specific)/adenine-specific DNA-methyltransferase
MTSGERCELTYDGKVPVERVVALARAAKLREVARFGGAETDSWTNKLILGDNLGVLKALLELKWLGKLRNADGTEGARLIYIDPPYATQKNFGAYHDGLVGVKYLEWLRQRLILLRELLAENGSIYVHLDYRKGHYVKVLLDEVFGEANFINEIVWHDARWTKVSDRFQRMHSVIFWYRKGERHIYNPQYKPYAAASQLAHAREGFIRRGTAKVAPDARGVAADDVWTDKLAGNAAERVGYPTQKPEALLGRVIAASSNPGDLVLDCFSGSGTTAVVAAKLGRRWVMVDASRQAIEIQGKRLMRLQSAPAFTLYSTD